VGLLLGATSECRLPSLRIVKHVGLVDVNIYRKVYIDDQQGFSFL